jgi:hypothetical protein
MFEIYSIHDHWPKRGTVRVTIGAPLHIEDGSDEEAATRAIEEAVRRMSAAHLTS